MRYTFESFLCRIPVRDYIYQKEEREIRRERAGKMLKNTEKVLVLSTNVDNQFTKAGLPAEEIFRQI